MKRLKLVKLVRNVPLLNSLEVPFFGLMIFHLFVSLMRLRGDYLCLPLPGTYRKAIDHRPLAQKSQIAIISRHGQRIRMHGMRPAGKKLLLQQVLRAVPGPL